MLKPGKVILICVTVVVANILALSGCMPAPVENDIPQEVIEARDKAIELARQDGVPVPERVEWEAYSHTLTNLLGYTTFEFTTRYEGDEWTVRVGYPVVLDPHYDVLIFRSSEELWQGEIFLS